MNFIAMVCLVSAIASGPDVRPNLDAARLLTGSFSFRTLVNGAEVGRSRIQVRSHIKLNETVFPAEDYNSLRDFFGFIIKKYNEQIVFKKKK